MTQTQSTTDSSTTAATPLPSPKERRRLREAKSLSEDQLANAVGVTRATIRSWETGRTNPRGRKREAYAKLLATYQAELAAKPEGAEAETGAGAGAATGAAPAAKIDRAEGTEGTDRTETAPEVQERPRTPDLETDEPREPTLHPSGPVPAEAASPPPPPVPALTPEQAFDELYCHAASGLVRQVHLLTGRREFSLEAVERAFHVAWERWPEVAVDRDPVGWVRAVAYEYAMSPWHRLRRSHRRPEPTDPVVTGPGTATGPGPGPATADPDGPTLRETLLELPPTYRRTLLLYDGLGLDLPETAAETEASTPAAASRLMHARAAVAELMPELAEPEQMQERLSDLLVNAPAPELASARAVRAGSERRTRFWTRAAIGLTAAILGAAAVAMATSQSHYEPPQAPGEPVGGVAPRFGPPAFTRQDVELRTMLEHHPRKGPERLLPSAR
ncbi:sigma factor-like helix-turn-helix DNA-binding protein [Streptomyces formicae]|uniref:Helix-turn-helix domain-containing protein n=1 Tax=Streptomyces formicae TaxID=1616117 RepID=A0ABY3WE55_9ACTN|nr:sigma factor-like helix-turn-helix DNA-binding protein [Streptomyces formicae]UNM10843.1 helix-turn-helix domain-containing protein [Streptomyces formicae]